LWRSKSNYLFGFCTRCIGGLGTCGCGIGSNPWPWEPNDTDDAAAVGGVANTGILEPGGCDYWVGANSCYTCGWGNDSAGKSTSFNKSLAETPDSACLRMLNIWLSVNLDCFIIELLFCLFFHKSSTLDLYGGNYPAPDDGNLPHPSSLRLTAAVDSNQPDLYCLTLLNP
jgi:hypothetical protein